MSVASKYWKENSHMVGRGKCAPKTIFWTFCVRDVRTSFKDFVSSQKKDAVSWGVLLQFFGEAPEEF